MKWSCDGSPEFTIEDAEKDDRGSDIILYIDDDCKDFLEKYTKNTVRFIIKKDLRWQARDLLDQLNISERIVYPGLDGLSKWLERHYYVKDGE